MLKAHWEFALFPKFTEYILSWHEPKKTEIMKSSYFQPNCWCLKFLVVVCLKRQCSTSPGVIILAWRRWNETEWLTQALILAVFRGHAFTSEPLSARKPPFGRGLLENYSLCLLLAVILYIYSPHHTAHPKWR